MDCVNHPNRKAVGHCEECLAGLCDSCIVHMEDDRTLCNQCMSTFLLEDVKAYTRNRQLRREAQGKLSKGWRPNYLQVMLTMGVVLAVLLFGLRIYWSKSIPHSGIVLDPTSQMKLLTKLQFALERYATEHGDRYPDDLYDLLPDYLVGTEQNRHILSMLYYKMDQQEGYVVSVKKDAPFPGEKLVATAKDIRLAEIE